MKRILRTRLSKLAGIALLASFGLGSIWWARSRPVPVARATVRRASVASEVMGTGTLEARVSAVISPRVAGLLADVLVDQGDHVRRGQLLATLQDGDLREQVRVAEADAAVARAAVGQVKAQAVAAEATALEARTSHGRASKLADARFVSDAEFDKAVQNRDVAEAELLRARSNEVAASRQVVKADATARYARERLADARILAPFDGYVVKRVRDPGNVAVPGDAVLQLISLREMWIAAWVDETQMAALAVGQRARVVFRSEPNAPYEGKVARIEPQVDPETREFLVDVALSRLPSSWGVGQRAEVYIDTASKDGVLVAPVRAVVEKKGRSGVFVADSGHARWRPVELGLRGNETVEVRAGLREGDMVVWPPDPAAGMALSDGRSVNAP